MNLRDPRDNPNVLKWRRLPRDEDSGSWSAIYEARDQHGVAGSVVRTGRYGADDYPWDWHVDPFDRDARYSNGQRVRTSGSADTLRSAKDQAEQAARLTRGSA